MHLSAWWLLPAAVPVLLLGEVLVRRVSVLARFAVPVPVVGGLVVAAAILVANVAGWEVVVDTKVTAKWWTWLIVPEVEWLRGDGGSVYVYQPLVVAFFTCVGLNASWGLVRRGSWPLVALLVIATVLGVVQNLVGVGLCKVMGAPPLLGVLCGSVTMTGGHGTAMGFAGAFEEVGFKQAGVVGAAAATFGLVAGSLVGGPLGSALVRRHRLEGVGERLEAEGRSAGPGGFVLTIRSLLTRREVWAYVLLLLACIKVGAWVSYGLRALNLKFPVYMGAMLVGIAARNLIDAIGQRRLSVDTRLVETIGSVLLGLFLTMAMVGLNLAELAGLARPMVVLLGVQTVVMVAFAWWVTFRLMGRDYPAAVVSSGHVGFGLGNTANAVANMETLATRYGPSPRAVLVVTIVGAFLIDFTNAVTITFFLNWFK